MEENVIPLPYIHDVIPWDCKNNIDCAARLNKFISQGWELVTIHNNLAYFRRINPDYITFINRENDRMLRRRRKSEAELIRYFDYPQQDRSSEV